MRILVFSERLAPPPDEGIKKLALSHGHYDHTGGLMNVLKEHGGRILRTATRVLHDVNLAHDVHQEVFLAIWRRWHTYNGEVNWPAYLYRVTVRKALQIAGRRFP